MNALLQPAFEPAEPRAAMLQLERDVLGDFAAVSAREWLVTNGLGGYASGTVGGANTRRYHGFLVAALRPPLARTVMVAKVDVVAHYRGQRVCLATNQYGDGTVDPRGYSLLQSFRLEGQVPVWTWLVGDALLEQRVWMAYGENTSYMQWRLLRATSPLQLELHPLCTWRDYHWHHRGRREPHLSFDDQGVRVDAFDGAAPYRLSIDPGTCEARRDWYWNFHHSAEQARGLDAAEDLFRPAVFHLQLQPGDHAALTASSELHATLPAEASLARQRSREDALLRAADPVPPMRHPDQPAIRQLVLAADQFLVARLLPDGRPGGRTVIAGYPWFGDWGRDTMIALPGLTLSTGREREAADVLRTFARHVSQGMLPNRFPDDGEAPEYNTVDATLWYFVAIHRHLERTQDATLRRDLLPVLEDIVDWHRRGTRFGIAMDPADALLRAGTEGVQLTWMDARIGDWVVTPRTGKAVEINALWINALRILASLYDTELRPEEAIQIRQLADLAAQSFRRRFWNESTGHLNDVIDTPQGPVDASLRPNQIFALSLPFPLIEGDQARAVIEACLQSLWTPVGLRSLAPGHPAFAGRYAGGPRERDAVYHQGTVWSWLLGPFALAHYRVHRDRPAALALLSGLLPHLREACVGQISEIFDGDAPFAPAGCMAQAWSVAETLRAWSEIHECQPAST